MLCGRTLRSDSVFTVFLLYFILFCGDAFPLLVLPNAMILPLSLCTVLEYTDSSLPHNSATTQRPLHRQRTLHHKRQRIANRPCGLDAPIFITPLSRRLFLLAQHSPRKDIRRHQNRQERHQVKFTVQHWGCNQGRREEW
jgi:hypothetical protein